jgi:hypothetical protein
MESHINIKKDAPSVEHVHRFLQQTNVAFKLLQIFQKLGLRGQSHFESLMIVARLHNREHLITEEYVKELRVPLKELDHTVSRQFLPRK